MTTGLERIATKAQNERKQCFTSLIHHLTPQLLWDCLKTIPKSSGVGIDGMDVETAKATFNEWAQPMIDAVHRRGYKPPAVKRVYIPKPGKKAKRPIGIPSISDRVLQKAVAKILEQIYEQDFTNSSYGGRPKRSAHNAIATLQYAIARRKTGWVYEADLKSFFCSLNHGWVEQFLSLRVADPRITTLIKRWLKAGVMEESQLQETVQGVPQGGPISVLISNLYLHYALDLWVEKVVKPKLRGAVHYIRYLDDFVLCFQHEDDAKRFERVIEKRLTKFGLSLEPSKTRLVRFGRYSRNIAHRRGEKQETIYFLGLTIYCDKTRFGDFKVGFKTEKSRLRRMYSKVKRLMRRMRHLPLLTQRRAINRVLVGFYNYYAISGNLTALRNVYYFAVKYWRKCLSSRSQRGKVNWEKYRRLLKIFPLREPKIKLTYRALNNMVLL